MIHQKRGALRLAVQAFAIIAFYTVGTFFHLAPLRAQVRVSAWQTYSAMRNVRAVATDRAGNLWAGTSGGVFSYNLQSRAIREFRNINALFGLDITALAVNSTDGTVYAGGFNGALNIYDGKNWSLVSDIFTANLNRKQINGFLFHNDLVFVAGDFGLTVFDPRRRIFTETVQRFATLQPGSAVRKIMLAQGRIWVATERGVASAPTGLRTYANPSAWRIHPFNADTLGASSITESDGKIFASEGRNLWVMTNNVGAMRFDSIVRTVFEPIRSIASLRNQVFVGTDGTLLNSLGENQTQIPFQVNSLATIDSAGQERLVLCARQGFMLWSNINSTFIPLNSPADNRFRSVTVDTKGRLWCVSGSGNPNAVPNDGSPTGISMLQDTTWRVFNAGTHPQMRSNAYFQIDAQANGTVWASGYGPGTVLIQPDSNFRLQNFYSSNANIPATVGTDFNVLGQAQTDSRTGTVWIPNWQVGGDSVLLSRTPQGRFINYGRVNLPEKRVLFCAIDRSGTKWLTSWRGQQMLAFNERGTPDNRADDLWYQVPQTEVGVSQNCITADNEDRIWIGTATAALTIINPGVILNTPSGNLIVDSPRKLRDQTYNAIAVDALNYKWFGTNNGVIVYDSNRDTILARFTTENSPLASNSVLSIAIDNNSGKIYFGTDNGLSVATTLSIRPNTDFAAMRCYPQPFIPTQDNELVIDGLTEGTQVKITTIDGLLVRTFPTSNSRTVVWDGLDEQRQPVQSGVYLISAYSDNVGTNAVIKAMVIQRN